MKFQNTKDKEIEHLKERELTKHRSCKGTRVKLPSDFSLEVAEAKRQFCKIFKILKENVFFGCVILFIYFNMLFYF